MNVSGERSIGAESIQVALSGDNTRVVVLPEDAVKSATEVEAPAQAGYLPRSTSGVFIGRETELSALRDSLTGGGSAAVVQPQRTPVQTISGLGGVGKSALALHYATRYRSHYTLVWWITADSPESILTSLAEITQRLCPHTSQTLEPDQRAAWAITWLQAHPDWLLIFDNVENPEHLGPYLGTLSGGHHLATSRRATGWQALAPVVSLGLLPPDEATDLLCTIAFPGATVDSQQRKAAKRLAHDLGYLPGPGTSRRLCPPHRYRPRHLPRQPRPRPGREPRRPKPRTDHRPNLGPHPQRHHRPRPPGRHPPTGHGMARSRQHPPHTP